MGTSSLIRSLQTRENSLPTLTGFDTSTTSLLWFPGFKLPTWNLLSANFASIPPSPPLTVSISLATPWSVACQAPLSTGFSRQEYCSGFPFPSPGYLPDPGIELSLLLYRWILYHLSQQGSPKYEEGYKEHSSVSFFFFFCGQGVFTSGE